MAVAPALSPAFEALVSEFKIHAMHVKALQKVANYSVSLIVDDSSSMATKVSSGSGGTRWEEMKKTAHRVLSLVFSLTGNAGVHVFFVNRMPQGQVITSLEQLAEHFAAEPEGPCQMVPAVSAALSKKTGVRSKLLLIATGGTVANEKALEESLRNRDMASRVCIMAISDCESELRFLEQLDRSTIFAIDVVDDYEAESRKVKMVQGEDFPYSKGDHLACYICGAIHHAYGLLNECKVVIDGYTFRRAPPPPRPCCSVQ